MKTFLYIVFYFRIALVLFTGSIYAQSTADDFDHLKSISEGVNAPLRLATDGQGITYVTDTYRKSISKYDASGNFLETIDVVHEPVSLAVNDDGQLFIGDGATGHIFIYDESLGAREFYTASQYPSSMEFSPENILYVADSELQLVVALDISGNVVKTIGSGILDFPTGIAFDNNNKRILVGEHGGKGTGFKPVVKVWIFDLEGNLVSSFGSHGSGDGQFYRVQGLTVGKCGNIYVADPFQGRISIFDENGLFITKFGDFGLEDGQMNIPMDIVFDSQERLLVTSMNNSALELFTVTDTLPSSNIKTRSTMICSGESTDIEIAFTGTAPWTFTYTIDGLVPTEIITTDNPYILSVSEAGHYELSSLSDANYTATCFTGSADIIVNSSVPTSVMKGDTIICSGSTTNISIDFTGSAPWNFTYTLDNLNPTTVITTNNPYILKVSEAGHYAVTDLNGGGCTGTSFSGSADISVKPLPTAIITNGNGLIPIDPGDTAEITVALTGLAPWEITYTIDDLTPTIISNINEPSYILKASNIGTYEVKEVSDTWCSNTVSLGYPELVMKSSLPLPTSNMTGGDQIICPGESAAISIQFTGEAPWTFTYSVGTIFTTTVRNTYTNPYTINALYDGTYEVIALSDNNYTGYEFNGDATIIKNPLPVPNFNYSSNSLEVSFLNTSIDADSYYWDFGDETTSVESDPIHQYQTSGEYVISLTAANELCDDVTISKNIIVESVSIEVINFEKLLKIFPNPTSGLVNIELNNPSQSEIRVEIISISGSKIYFMEYREQYMLETINLSHFPNGLYLVRVVSKDMIRTEKLIISE